jgi:hypothetical protein
VIVHHDGRIRAEPVLWLGGQDFDLEIHNGQARRRHSRSSKRLRSKEKKQASFCATSVRDHLSSYYMASRRRI